MTITQADGGLITAAPAGHYHYGDVVVLTLTRASGWHVGSWTSTTNNSSTASTNSLTMPDADQSGGMSYSQNVYTLKVTTMGNGSVSCDILRPCHHGEAVQLGATTTSRLSP